MVGSGAGGADGLRDPTDLDRATCREREGRKIGAKGARMERMGKEVKGMPSMAHRLAPIYMQSRGRKEAMRRERKEVMRGICRDCEMSRKASVRVETPVPALLAWESRLIGSTEGPSIKECQPSYNLT